MTNFDTFLSTPQFSSFAPVAVSAERILPIDPSACVLNCRRAMEFAVKWMYSVDKALVMPYQDTLVSLMNTEDFRDIVGADIWRRMDLIRRMGNNAAHTGRKITEEQAVLCLENLYVFLDFVAYCYGENYTEGQFDRSLLQQPAEPAPQGDKRAADIDFAALMADIADCVDDEMRRRVMKEIFYHLGRWIYLVDAADDFEKDAHSNCYNPLRYRYELDGDKLDEQSREAVAASLDLSVHRMASAYALLSCGVWTSILDSIFYESLYGIGSAVLKGTYHKPPRRIHFRIKAEKNEETV